MEYINKHPKLFQWTLLLLAFFGLVFAIDVPEGYKFIRAQAEHVTIEGQSTYDFFGTTVSYTYFNFLWRLPPWLGWLPIWINDVLQFLLNDWWEIEFWDSDLGDYKSRPLMLHVTRFISATLLFFIEFVREIFIGGVKTVVTFTSWDWIDANPWAEFPGTPWTIVTVGAAILGYKLSGRGLAIFAAITMIYISIFGQWEPSMQTLSFILVAAPLSFIFGLSLGIMAYKSKKVEGVLSPILLVMQTMPQYAFLVPAMVLFGIGDHAGALITIVVATPPMILLTLLGLRGIPLEVIEAGKMSGCNNFTTYVQSTNSNSKKRYFNWSESGYYGVFFYGSYLILYRS